MSASIRTDKLFTSFKSDKSLEIMSRMKTWYKILSYSTQSLKSGPYKDVRVLPDIKENYCSLVSSILLNQLDFCVHFICT